MELVLLPHSLVVGFHAPNMRGTVHQPRQVHRNHVAGHGGDVPTVGEGVSDQVPGNDGGQQEAQEGHHEDEVPEGGII